MFGLKQKPSDRQQQRQIHNSFPTPSEHVSYIRARSAKSMCWIQMIITRTEAKKDRVDKNANKDEQENRLKNTCRRHINRRSSEIQGTALGKRLQAWPIYIYIYRSRPAGVAQSGHAFVGGTVSTWARWRITVNKGRKGIRNADQALTVRGEHADRIVGSPSW